MKKEADLGKTCEELHDDMFGYSGEISWRSKFAVIYQAGAFWTDARVKAHMKKVGGTHFPETGMPLDWTLVLVTGLDSRALVRKRRLGLLGNTKKRRTPRRTKIMLRKRRKKKAP